MLEHAACHHGEHSPSPVASAVRIGTHHGAKARGHHGAANAC
jgi:hypothetical protein